MALKVERIPEIPNLILGEGPHWDIATQSLYFVDILGKSAHKYVPSTGQHTKTTFEKAPALIIPVEGARDQFVVNQEKEIAIATWNGTSETPSKLERLAEVEPDNQNKLNDGKCDASGRLWTGTIGSAPENSPLQIPTTGNLFSLQKGKLNLHVEKIACSNGLAWDTKLNKFYYIDSMSGGVDAFDFDNASGTISNKTTVFALKKHGIEGLPDGMTIDADGNLWVAVFGGYKVLQIDPRKPETLLQTIDIPAKQVTSVAWGGANLDELFVTTGNAPFDGLDLSLPDNGATFKVTGLGTKGLPANNFVL